MQSTDFEPDLYKKWFRRPTIFVAVAWMLLCAAGKIVLTKLAVPLGAFLAIFGLYWPRAGVTMALDLAYKLGVMVLPVAIYIRKHDGVTQAMRIRAPTPMMALYGVIIGAALAPLSRTVTVLWTILLEAAGGKPVYAVYAPTGVTGLVVTLLIDAVLTGFCEEFMMRGALIGAWERRGAERALVVSTLFSAALAGSITDLPSNFIVHLTFGLIAVMGSSLWPAIMAHVVYSALMIALDYLSGGSVVIASLYQTIVAEGRLNSYLISLGWAAALWLILMVVYRALGRYAGRFDGFKSAKRPEEMDAGEVLVLFIVFLTVSLIVGEDFMAILSFK